MEIQKFTELLGAEFYTGVPDSQLRSLCDWLMKTYGIDPAHHLIAANEGNCTALAAGYHMATGKVPVVYMQNSGEGNVINPVASLLNEHVYAIPMIFVIGWRGEPDIHDEPQHVYQGKVTLKLLEDMSIEFVIVSPDTTEAELKETMSRFRDLLKKGKQVAFVIRKGALTCSEPVQYRNFYSMTREEAIRHIVAVTGEDPVVSTTGKASRELFEIREANHQSHQYDFLTVGSMGHASSIALGIAIQKPEQKVWCLDGDGALLMHMGSLAVIGQVQPKNLIHIVINNEAHETVGGMPTASSAVSLIQIAAGCGYTHAVSVDNFEALDAALKDAKNSEELMFLEVKCSLGARSDLGRPTTTALANKEQFMKFLKDK